MKRSTTLCCRGWILGAVVLLATGCQSLSLSNQQGRSTMQVDSLRCEYRLNPLGIDEKAPRLSWKVHSKQRGQRQTAYQIVVASDASLLSPSTCDGWNSGKVESNQAVNIEYAGKPLTSRQVCYWKVRVWDAKGKPSQWSQAAMWSMGLLKRADWKARWISFHDRGDISATQKNMVLPPPHYYRKTFTTKKSIRRATVYATALGVYELQINGQRVSDSRFTPGWSDYKKRVYYNTFDVTDLLQSGKNAIGAVVADGWYSGYVGYALLLGFGPDHCGRYIYGKTPYLRVQLEIEYEDGSKDVVVTDKFWKVNTGPILQADLLMGETYDARLEQAQWSQPEFNDLDWEQAVFAKENGSLKKIFYDQRGDREVELGFVPPKKLQAYPSVPIRKTEEIRPIEITEPQEGVYIFNMGQNFSGVVRLKVRGKKGQRIQLRFGEMLHPDGRLMTENLRKAKATDVYILRGDKHEETWTPKFTYHGFQYVEVTGLTEKPGLDTVTGIVLHSDTPRVSSFVCSDPMINQLFSNVVWTQRSNFFEIPTDCPQRDERLGWMGDAQIYGRTATYNADVAAFFTKWLDDVEEAQLPSGAYPDYAPYSMMHGKPKKGFATAWMDAGIICPYTIYKVYGDTRIIERHYDSMKRFMAFRRNNSLDYLGVAIGNGYGDWLSLGSKTPIEYIDTVYFAYTSQLMTEMAEAIGKTGDAQQYQNLFQLIKRAFRKKYVLPEGRLQVDNQTAYVLALMVGLMPDELQQAASQRLVELIDQNQGRMTTGFIGTKPLLPVLTQAGYNDLALRLFQSREFPSWGYEVENGATTIWERWNSFTKDKGFADVGMNSFSHYAFGAVCEWMFRSLAGIDTDGVGFKKIIIHPHPPTPGSNQKVKPIHWVKAEYDSIHGLIRSEWERKPGSFRLTIKIPANTYATVFLPGKSIQSVRESGKSLNRVKGIVGIEQKEEEIILQVESGTYQFTSKL